MKIFNALTYSTSMHRTEFRRVKSPSFAVRSINRANAILSCLERHGVALKWSKHCIELYDRGSEESADLMVEVMHLLERGREGPLEMIESVYMMLVDSPRHLVRLVSLYDSRMFTTNLNAHATRMVLVNVITHESQTTRRTEK